MPKNKRPVYCYIGPDSLKIKDKVKEIEDSVFQSKPEREVNLLTYFGDEGNIEELLSNCYNYPAFSEYKLIKVYNFDKLDIKNFVDYLHDPTETTILVLLSEKEDKEINKTKYQFDGKKLTFQEIVKTKGVFEYFPSKYASQMMDLFVQKLNQKGYKFSKESIDFIITQINNTEGEVDKIIEMIETNLGNEKVLTLKQLDQIISISKEPEIWEFTEYFFLKDIFNTIKTLRILFDEKENFMSLVFNLATQIEKLWFIKNMVEKNISKTLISQELHVHPFICDKLIKQSHNFSYSDFERLLSGLYDLEYFFKSNDTKLHLVKFEMFVMNNLVS